MSAAGTLPPGPQTDGHRGIEVAAGDVADGIGHGQHRQAEGQRHAREPDAQFRKAGGEHRAAAATEHQPERAEELGAETMVHFH